MHPVPCAGILLENVLENCSAPDSSTKKSVALADLKCPPLSKTGVLNFSYNRFAQSIGLSMLSISMPSKVAASGRLGV